ncbi:hypothetical protein HG263_13065 [Pseudoalteromonas sp. JBTF-M23]|uniref:Tail specific protease domain-containing protein n=1 Tax=Pseudoalteromonas caenipelagi TaxID=2726988 RepID=A0A849VIA3_9GAMM|nr:S41 family peptidase [Pseudoalteromonas caenipelagi]NOU51461.1 hypothetical protein [Pseudoalteromonas caenipelagi]
MRPLISGLRLIFASIVMLIFATNAAASGASVKPFQHHLSVAQALEDIDQWFNWLHQTHPDLSHSVKNVDEFYDTVAQIKASINAPLNAMQLWQKMAPLNSMLADGHLKVGHGSSSQWRQWISEGVAFFPFEVKILDGHMIVNCDLAEQNSQYKGAKIVSVNGKSATVILNKLLTNTHGDTLAFRENVLQSQFNRLFYMTFGSQETFSIELEHNNKIHNITVKAKSAIPSSLAQQSFADAFNISYSNTTALLTVNTFAWDDFKQFLTYMDNTFSAIKDNKVNHLIIDIRNNGGGNDDMWMAGILRYIADKPYRHFSTYRSKILLKYRDPGQIVGDIEQGENTRLIQPEPELSNFYHGKTSLLIGTGTYSSAIVFANTVQGYDFAKLIGSPTGGRSTQSGGIQFMTLNHSQLQMISPRFLLTRPSGIAQMTPVQPELTLSHAGIPASLKNNL